MDTISEHQTLESLQKHRGLSSTEVIERRRQYGENSLPAEKSASAWAILLAQLKSPLVYIILAAAGVSLVVGEYGDLALSWP